MTTDEYLEKRKSKDWNFNPVVPLDSFMNVQKIHPLKQKIVKSIVDNAKADSHVKSIIVFGSSVRYDCHPFSDLDICIDWTEDCYTEDGILKPFTCKLRSLISSITEGNADVINYQDLDDTVVKDDVLNRGIIVYEHIV